MTWRQLAGEDEDAVITEVSQLVVDCQRHPDTVAARALLRHQLAVLLLRLALGSADRSTPRPEDETFHRFCREVEHSYAHTRRVEDYAAELRCSVRTLTRACLAVTGRSAKQVIDERVALQAGRLLAATDQPIAQIGRQLGFSEPTNFGRFFTREVGVSPGAFRAARDQPGRPGDPTPTAGRADGRQRRRFPRRRIRQRCSHHATRVAHHTGQRHRAGMMARCRSPRAATTRYGQR